MIYLFVFTSKPFLTKDLTDFAMTLVPSQGYSFSPSSIVSSINALSLASSIHSTCNFLGKRVKNKVPDQIYLAFFEVGSTIKYNSLLINCFYLNFLFSFSRRS